MALHFCKSKCKCTFYSVMYLILLFPFTISPSTISQRDGSYITRICIRIIIYGIYSKLITTSLICSADKYSRPLEMEKIAAIFVQWSTNSFLTKCSLLYIYSMIFLEHSNEIIQTWKNYLIEKKTQKNEHPIPSSVV